MKNRHQNRYLLINKGKHFGSVMLFVLPAFVPLVVFWIFPILQSIFISFTNWDYMTSDFQFIGVQNYLSLFRKAAFSQALINTLVFSLGTILPTIALGLGLALLLQRAFRGSKIYRTLIFSPWITPTVAVSIVWTWIYDPKAGIANQLLGLFGIAPQSWISSSNTAMLSVIIVTVWKGIGYTMVFYLSALERVPRELYEAAEIDSANGLQKFWHITMPSISPTTLFLTIVNSITALQAYDQIQILTQGGPSGSTRTLLYYYYQLGFEQFQTGQAAAVSVVLLIITVVLSLIQFGISNKSVTY